MEATYCAKYNEDSDVKFLEKIAMLSDDNHNLTVFSVDEVQTAIAQQKCGKAVGPDHVLVEAYKYSEHRLAVYLALFFNLRVYCGYLPKLLICPSFVPIVKNKSGDLTDVNNYRVIAISNSCTKILESILYNCYQYILGANMGDISVQARSSS